MAEEAADENENTFSRPCEKVFFQLFLFKTIEERINRNPEPQSKVARITSKNEKIPQPLSWTFCMAKYVKRIPRSR